MPTPNLPYSSFQGPPIISPANFMFTFNNLKKKIYCVSVVLAICVWGHTWLTKNLPLVILLNKGNSLSSEGCCLEGVERTVLC